MTQAVKPLLKIPTGLYPEITPFQMGHLACGRHQIYYEVSGNPKGVPVIMVHGGPGGGSSPHFRRMFDPLKTKIITFDQRGCGHSRPHVSKDRDLSDNKTSFLISDMESLRTFLNIDRWLVFGGSWGSTLSLAYAIEHPERVLGLILRGIFLVRRSEIEWFYQNGASHIWPDLFEAYQGLIPLDQHHDLIEAYYQRLHGNDVAAAQQAALAWSRWEGATLSIDGPPMGADKFHDPEFALAFARIESWYFKHKGFFASEDWAFEGLSRIDHIPTIIVQGRYDVVTPIKTAYELHKAWPQSDLRVILKGGHSSSDTEILKALLRANAEMVEFIRNVK